MGTLDSALALPRQEVLRAQGHLLHVGSPAEAPGVGWHLPGACGMQSTKGVWFRCRRGPGGAPSPGGQVGADGGADPMLVAPVSPATCSPLRAVSSP